MQYTPKYANSSIVQRAKQALGQNPGGRMVLATARNESELVEAFEAQVLRNHAPDVEQNLRLSLGL